MAENFDELRKQMEADELADATKLTPIEYGRMRGIKPQLVYYHLRAHGDQISLERCLCGKPVIDVKKADEYFHRGEFDPNYQGKEEDE